MGPANMIQLRSQFERRIDLLGARMLVEISVNDARYLSSPRFLDCAPDCGPLAYALVMVDDAWEAR